MPSANTTYNYGMNRGDNLTGISELGLRMSTTGMNEIISVTNTLNGTTQNWRYDQAGKVTDDGERSYAWDAENRLIKVTVRATGDVVQYSYDGQSKCYSRTVNGETTRYLWCDEVSICQTRNGFDVPQTSYYGQGEITGAVRRYYHRDHLGSVVDVLNPSGVRLAQLNYTSYGALKSSQANTGVTLPNHRYAGMWWDDKANLYLTHYRAYSPTVGRWLSRDPIAENGGVNLYAYARNNPITFNDLDGKLFGLPEIPWSPFYQPTIDEVVDRVCNCRYTGFAYCRCVFGVAELFCSFEPPGIKASVCLVQAKNTLDACAAHHAAD